jgi:hypothetical protein
MQDLATGAALAPSSVGSAVIGCTPASAASHQPVQGGMTYIFWGMRANINKNHLIGLCGVEIDEVIELIMVVTSVSKSE